MEKKTIELPLMGKVALEYDAQSEYKYSANLFGAKWNNNPIDLDVNFRKVTDDAVTKVKKALNELKRLNELGLESLKADFDEGGEAQEYIEAWNEDIFEQIFSPEEFAAFIADTDPKKSIEERLLSKLRLVRFGVYAQSEEEFIVMDYAFGYDLDRGFRDNMLIVKLDPDYEVSEITMEG